MRKEVIIKIRSQFHEVEPEKTDAIRFLTEMKHAASEDAGAEITSEGFDAMLRSCSKTILKQWKSAQRASSLRTTDASR